MIGPTVNGRTQPRLLDLTGGPTAIVSLSGGLWCQLDAAGRFRGRGGPWKDRLGWEGDVWRRLRFWELVHPAEVSKAAGAGRSLTGSPDAFHVRMLTGHGRYLRLHWRAQRAGDGLLLVSAPADVPSRVAETRAMYRGLYEATFEAVFVHADGVIVDCNEEAVRLLGYGVKELVGMEIWRLAPGRARDEVRTRIASDEMAVSETWARHADGREVPVTVRARTVDSDGQRLRVVVVREGHARRRQA